jgi:hypothetical protein
MFGEAVNSAAAARGLTRAGIKAAQRRRGNTPMGWERRGDRRYYTRSKKVNGRVVRQYFGTGPIAELAADLDAVRWLERREERRKWRRSCEEWDEAEELLERLCSNSDRLAALALGAAGYHRHDRGNWRRKRHDGNDAQGQAGRQ